MADEIVPVPGSAALANPSGGFALPGAEGSNMTPHADRPSLRPALPGAVPAGYWDSCPHCGGPVYMPVAGSRDSKAPLRCPGCQAILRPDC